MYGVSVSSSYGINIFEFSYLLTIRQAMAPKATDRLCAALDTCYQPCCCRVAASGKHGLLLHASIA